MTPSDIARHAAQVLRDHADICSRAGQSAVLLEEAEAIEQELAAMAGPAPDPQGADDRCRVSENGSVSHRWACDFGPDCPAPGGVMHNPQGADEPPAYDEDRLYLDLKGARERLCRASVHVPAHWQSDLSQAVAIIDNVGSSLVPIWSKDNQPEYPEPKT